MSLKQYKSQGKAVKVTVNSKEESLKTFVWISSKNLASVLYSIEAEFLNLDLENDSKESILPAYEAWRPGGPVRPMRPMVRGLVQHGNPPGWLEESDPAGVILYST